MVNNDLFNWRFYFKLKFIIKKKIGAYKNGVSPDGFILSDHMTLASVVATILILDNTAQVCEI